MEMFPRQAAELLAEVDELQRRSRHSLGEHWFPAVCFGAVAVLSAPLVAIAGVSVLGPVWIVASAIGMALTIRHYRKRARSTGVTGQGRRVWLMAAAMACLCLVAGYLGGAVAGASVGLTLPMVVVLIGYIAVGRMHRDAVPAACVAPAAALGIALVLFDLRPWLIEGAFGVALMCAGAAMFGIERSRSEQAARP